MFIKNKIAIITGGASGLGYCYAVELLKNDLRGVTLADNDTTKGEEAVSQLSKEFGATKVLFVKTDVTNKSQLENAFKMTVKRFKNIDILINNAGIMNDLLWEKQIDINLKGTIYGCLLAMEEYMPKYKSGHEGVIVNIASVLGLSPVTFLPFYVATKHAIVGLGRSLGLPEQYESTKVRVITICPGATNTPLLENLDDKMINQRYLELLMLNDLYAQFPLQNAHDVPPALIKAIEEGKTGSFWIVEGVEIYEVELPEKQQLKKCNL